MLQFILQSSPRFRPKLGFTCPIFFSVLLPSLLSSFFPAELHEEITMYTSPISNCAAKVRWHFSVCHFTLFSHNLTGRSSYFCFRYQETEDQGNEGIFPVLLRGCVMGLGFQTRLSAAPHTFHQTCPCAHQSTQA